MKRVPEDNEVFISGESDSEPLRSLQTEGQGETESRVADKIEADASTYLTDLGAIESKPDVSLASPETNPTQPEQTTADFQPETYFERRHEILDEELPQPANPAEYKPDLQMTSVGEVLEHYRPIDGLPQNANAIHTVSRLPKRMYQLIIASPTYKRAVLWGAIFAVVLTTTYLFILET